MGNSSPLAVHTVMTWTASASDSIRRAVTSPSTSVSVSAPDAAVQSGQQSGHVGAAGRGGTLEQLDQMVEIGHVPVPVRGRAAPWPPRRWSTRPGPTRRPPDGWPTAPTTRGGAPACPSGRHRMRWPPARRSSHRTRTARRCGPAGGRRVGPWRASSQRIWSAAGESSTLPALATTAGTPWAVSAAWTALHWSLVLTRTAMSWGRTGRVGRILSARRQGGVVEEVADLQRPDPRRWCRRPAPTTTSPLALVRRDPFAHRQAHRQRGQRLAGPGRRCDGPGSAAPR